MIRKSSKSRFYTSRGVGPGAKVATVLPDVLVTEVEAGCKVRVFATPGVPANRGQTCQAVQLEAEVSSMSPHLSKALTAERRLNQIKT